MNIDQICKKYNIENYSINPDGSIDVDGSVDLTGKKLKTLPLKFNNVSGSFWCNNNQLTTLEGGPKEVGGEFWCHRNQLTPYGMRYILFSNISGNFISDINDIDEFMNVYFSLSEQEKKQEIFKILAKLKEMNFNGVLF